MKIDLTHTIQQLHSLLRQPFLNKGRKRQLFALVILRAEIVSKLFNYHRLHSDPFTLTHLFCNHKCALKNITEAVERIFDKDEYNDSGIYTIFTVSWNDTRMEEVDILTNGLLAWSDWNE